MDNDAILDAARQRHPQLAAGDQADPERFAVHAGKDVNQMFSGMLADGGLDRQSVHDLLDEFGAPLPYMNQAGFYDAETADGRFVVEDTHAYCPTSAVRAPKTAADLDWGPEQNHEWELLIAGEPVAVLWLKDGRAKLYRRAWDLAESDDYRLCHQRASGAVYEFGASVLESDQDDPLGLVKMLAGVVFERAGKQWLLRVRD